MVASQFIWSSRPAMVWSKVSILSMALLPVEGNNVTQSDCLRRINHFRDKWGLQHMTERTDLHTCVNREAEWNKAHGAHKAFTWCGEVSQGEGGGSNCANVIDSFYNERWNCGSSAVSGSPYKSVNAPGEQQCKKACNDDSQCVSFDFVSTSQSDSCRFFKSGTTLTTTEEADASIYRAPTAAPTYVEGQIDNAETDRSPTRASHLYTSEEAAQAGCWPWCWFTTTTTEAVAVVPVSAITTTTTEAVAVVPAPAPSSGRTSCKAGSSSDCEGHCGAVMSSGDQPPVMSWGEHDGYYTVNYHSDPEPLTLGETCPSGLSSVVRCHHDSNTGILWATGLPGPTCNQICSLAGATQSTYHCDSSARLDGYSEVADLLHRFGGKAIECKHGSCWNGQTPKDNGYNAAVFSAESSQCYIPDSSMAYSCDVRLGNANCFGDRFKQVCPCSTTNSIVV